MYSCVIIVRTKNRNLLLKRALLSIAKQSYIDWQVVLVNDGGDAKELGCLVENFLWNNSLPAEKLILIQNAISHGMEAASNQAIRSSTSKYIALLDDDDTWDPCFLERSIGFLEKNSRYHGVACQANLVEEVINDDKIKTLLVRPYNSNLSSVNIPELLGQNRFTSNSFVYSRSAFEVVGEYDETLPVLGDWDFNLRFILKYDIKIIPEALVNYHMRFTVMSSDYDNSVTTRQNFHADYRAYIINKYSRRFFENQDYTGLGIMFFTALYDHGLQLTKLDDRVNAHLNTQLEVSFYKNSLSWKLTAPLRLIGKFVKLICSFKNKVRS